MSACSGPHFSKFKSLKEQKRNSQQFGGGACTKIYGAVWFPGLLFLLGNALMMYYGNMSSGQWSFMMHYINKSFVIHHWSSCCPRLGVSNKNQASNSMFTKDAFFLSLFHCLSPGPSLLLAPDLALPIAICW